MVFPENENSNSAEEKKSLNEDFHNETALDENLDDSKAKFLGNGNNDLHHDPHVVIELGSDIAFTGLGKEELMKYAEDPFWIRTRMILFIIFWVGWLAMLVAAILIIVFAPKCPERPDMKWYQTDIVYQINPKSFKDTSAKDVEGAGIGDLNGIASKVGYLQGLDINALYISAFYEAGESSYDGNDVVDHMKVDPIFGTMADFDALRKATKKKGMKIIVDFIPNHTGTKHDWFNKSRDRVGMDESSTAAIDYSDFYIWANSSGTDGAGNPIPPNNWVTVYGQPAWKYDSVRKQFYYFAYLPEYPDLNLRNPDVLNQLDGVLRFWLDKGVDGFVIQGLQQLVEHDNLGDDETSPGSYTRDHEENMKIMARWRGIINSYSEKPGRERVLIGLVSGGGNLTEQYQQAGVHIVITEALAKIDPDTCNNECIEESLKQAKPNGAWMGWMLDDGNTERFGSRVSEQMQRAFQALTMLLPGTPIVYYGDEIGMTNGNVDPAQAKDPLAKLGSMPRDNYRTPMLWTGGENAGFCAVNVTSWLPVNADYDKSSVEHRSAHNNGYSLLESFADLAKLRQKESIQFGSLSVETHKDKLLLITRKAPGFPSYLVAINLGQDSLGPLGLADKMTVVYDSQGENVGKEFQTKDTPIAFQHRGDVMIFEF